MNTGLAIALILVGIVVSGIVFFLVGMMYRKNVAEREIGSAEEEAKRILDEENFDYSQVITIGASNSRRQNIALIAQACFAEAGITLDVIQGENLFAAATNGEIDMTVMSWTSSASPTYWLAYQKGSYSRIQDSKYYDALTAVNVESDPEKKVQMMYDIQEVYARECPYIPLCQEYIYMVMADEVHGVSIPNVDQCWTWTMD